MRPHITVLGTGRMGSALARTFVQQDYRTTVWNRTSAKLEPLVAIGASAAASVMEAVTPADIVIVNVADYESVTALLSADSLAQALQGKLLVNLTSGSPRQAREMAAWAAKYGIGYLDGAIMATPDLIGTADSTILYAGDPRWFDKHKTTLVTLGTNAVHVGADVGLASALDSALLIVMWGSLFGTLQGIAICQAENISLQQYATLLAPTLQAIAGWSTDVVERVDTNRLSGDAETVASIDTHYGAFRCFLELCKERDLNVTLSQRMDELFRAARAKGHGDADFALLSRFMRA